MVPARGTKPSRALPRIMSPSRPDDTNPFEAVYLAAPLAMCAVDAGVRLRLANDRLAALFGRDRVDVVGERLEALAPELGDLVRQLEASPEPFSATVTLGSPPDVRFLTVLAAGAGPLRGLTFVDVSHTAPAAAELARSAERSAFALESAGQWVWDLDIPAGKVWRSQQWKRALGFAPGELEDHDEPWSIVRPSDRKIIDEAMRRIMSGEDTSFEATYRLKHRDGSWRWILSRGKVVAHGPDGRPSRVLATSTDITRQKQTEHELAATIRSRRLLEQQLVQANRRLRVLADIDSLTELPNRRKFDRVLEQEFRRVRRAAPSLALLMIDVDHFKAFNDLYGHPAGDDCLRTVAEELQAAVNPVKGLITRYGGEEFASILVNIEEEAALDTARRMIRAIRALALPHAASPGGHVTICVGMTLLRLENRRSAGSPQRLVELADRALYAAKAAGRDRIALWRHDSDNAQQGLIVVEPPAGVA